MVESLFAVKISMDLVLDVFVFQGGVSVASARRFGLLDQVLNKDEMRDQLKVELR